MEDLIKKLGDFFTKLSAGEIAIGVILSTIAQAYGGWTEGMTALVICMIIDYITGLVVAGLFHASKKTESGRLESRAGWKGLVRKVTTMMIVLVAAYVDKTFGTSFIRDAVVIGFMANEVISIVENAGLMGMPIPKAVVNMIDLLKIKAEESAGQVAPVRPEDIEPEEDPGTNNTIE